MVCFCTANTNVSNAFDPFSCPQQQQLHVILKSKGSFSRNEPHPPLARLPAASPGLPSSSPVAGIESPVRPGSPQNPDQSASPSPSSCAGAVLRTQLASDPAAAGPPALAVSRPAGGGGGGRAGARRGRGEGGRTGHPLRVRSGNCCRGDGGRGGGCQGDGGIARLTRPPLRAVTSSY